MADRSISRLFGIRPPVEADIETEGTPFDSDVQTVEDLLATLDLGQAPVRPRVGPIRGTFGALGDAFSAAAAVRAGGTPPRIGSFAATTLARQLDFEERLGNFEAERRGVGNRIRIGQFEQKAKEESLIRIGRAKGKTKDVLVRDFETTITQDMIDDFNLPKESLGKFMRVRDSVDKSTGIAIGRVILGPGVETSSPIITTEGIFPRGTKTNIIGEQLVHPVTKEPLRPFAEEMLFLRQEVVRLNEKKQFQLPVGILKGLTDEGIGVGAAEAALTQYVALGQPDLGFPFTIMQGTRLERSDRTTARRVISEAVVPIRKFFAGAAVTPTEAKASAPLIANLEEGVPPNVLIESLIGLINISRRARQRILLDARSNGLDVSGFESELSSGELNSINTLEDFLSGTTTNDLKSRVFVDEDGQLKVEE